MKKTKKIFLSVLTASCLTAAAFGFAACGEKTNNEPEAPQTSEESVVYTVTFETNGGTLLPEQGAEAGDKAVRPGDPKKAGFTFGGWYANAACTTEFNFESGITGDTTIYAKWNAAPTTDAEYFRLTQEEGGWSVAAMPGKLMPADVVIPSEIDGKTITSVAVSGFEDVGNVHSVTLPDTVTTIGQRAFRNCSDLEVVLGGANVEMIDSDAFDNTVWDNNLPAGEVYLGKTLYKYASSIFVETAIEVKEGTLGIASGAFLDQPNLIGITLPEGLKYIGSYAFGADSAENGNGISEVIIPDSVVEVGAAAFRYAPIETLIIGKGVEYIGAKAFADTTVTYLEYNAANGVIADATFSGMTAPATVTISDEVKTFPENIVKGWEGIVSLDLGTGITVIPAGALDGHAALSEVKFGSLTRIGSNAFRGTGIKEVTLPASLTYAGNSAFANCKNLQTVTVNAEHVGISGKTFPIFEGCSSLTTVNFGATVREIPDYFLYRANSLTTLGFERGVERIGMYAFYGTSVSGKLVLPEGLKVVGDHAFDAGTDADNTSFGTAPVARLQGLVVPSTLEEAGSMAFANNLALNYLAWNAANVTTTVYNVPGVRIKDTFAPIFSGCKALAYVNIGDTVQSLPEQFIMGCDEVKEVDIKKVATIGKEAFYGCTSLKSLGSNNGANIATLGQDALTGTAWLSNTMAAAVNKEYYIGKVLAGFSGTMPENYTLTVDAHAVVAIADGAFKGQKNLTKITLSNYSSNNTLTTIGVSAFEGCTGITSFSTVTKLTTIGDRAFYGCTGLTTVSLSYVETIGDSAFEGCTKLFADADFTIPATVVTIGNKAFYSCKIKDHALKVAANGKLKSIGDQAFYSIQATTVDLGNCEYLGDLWLGYFNRTITSFKAPALVHAGNYALAITTPEAVEEFEFTNVEYLGEHCIDGWTRTDYDFPKLKEMGLGMFGSYLSYGTHGSGDENVQSVHIGGELEEIPDQTFYRTTNLKTVTLDHPEALKKVGMYAFQESGVETIDISHVTYFADYAFTKSKIKLNDFAFDENVENIGNYAFQACSNITGSLTIRGKLDGIATYAFEDIPFTKLTVGGSIKSIGQRAFAGSVGYASEVVLEEGVENIDGLAFYNKKGETVNLPTTIVTVGGYTSNVSGTGLTGFAVIKLAGYIEPTDLTATVAPFSQSCFIVCDSDETVAQIKLAPVWDAFKDRAYGPSDIVSQEWIVDADGVALKYLGDKKNVNIPAEVKSISSISAILGTQLADFTAEGIKFTAAAGSGLKYENGMLTSADGKTLYFYNGTSDTVNNSTVISVGNYAFYGNKVAKTVTLPNAESIGTYSFRECAVETANLAKATTVASYAFYNASKLQTVTLGGITAVEDYTFYGCVALTGIALPSATEVKQHAFDGCKLLATVTGSNIVTVGNYGFANCNALASFDFGKVETVGLYAFTYNAFTEINLPKIKTVGSYAFRYHTALTKVTIGADCTSLGSYAFADATNNNFTVTVNATTPPTGSNVFGTAAQFAGTIKVPSAQLEAYKAATGWSTYADKIVAAD